MRLSAIYRYPIKSLRGHALSQCTLTAKGLRQDRRYMLVDDQRRFITQRQHAALALLDVQLHEQGLQVRHSQTGETLDITQPAVESPSLEVSVWRDVCAAQAVGRHADQWFSDFLGQSCHLVYLPDEAIRSVDAQYASSPGDQVGFADGYPFMVIGQSSLDLLNNKLQQQGSEPVSMLRFRPNLVVEGIEAHAEDDWSHIQIGSVHFDVVKPCSRCVIPSIDIATAQRGPEPTRTLMTYRRRDNKIYFGQNLIHRFTGTSQTLTVGDEVKVL